MRIAAWACSLLLTCGSIILAIPFTGHSQEPAPRLVRGTVVATNLVDDPQTIVLTVPLPNKEELIVGVFVPAATQITRGTQAARLADIKTGESAEMSYVRTSDGLIARSIHVRRP